MSVRVPPQPSAGVRTACPYCGVGCGIVAQPDGRGGAAISGDPEHPANFGKLCSKGSALGETLALGHRLLHPMLRQPDETLSRVPWEDALTRVAGGFRHIIDRDGPMRWLFISPATLIEDYYANKLMSAPANGYQLAALHVFRRGPLAALGPIRRPRRRDLDEATSSYCRSNAVGVILVFFPAHDAQQGRTGRLHVVSLIRAYHHCGSGFVCLLSRHRRRIVLRPAGASGRKWSRRSSLQGAYKRLCRPALARDYTRRANG